MNPKRLQNDEIRDVVFSPAEAVSAALETIEARRSWVGGGVPIGILGVDDYMLPGRPGELITVLGMTSNYKSGLMQWWARYTAKRIVKEHMENECVVYVTWEQAIEEMLAFDMASTAMLSATDVVQGKVSDEEMNRLRLVVGTQRATVPLYLIGHSLKEEKKRPRLSLSAVGQALMFIKQEWGLKPRAIFLDYLQQIEPEDGEDRRMQVFYNVFRCKDMSLAMACPVVTGVQVGRETYKEAWGVPNIASGLECSNIEHTSDKMLGTWLPKQTHPLGFELQAPRGKTKQTLTVTENLLILKLLKQKMGPAGQWWPLYVDTARNQIAPMQMEG